jgi:hypothetical protein
VASDLKLVPDIKDGDDTFGLLLLATINYWWEQSSSRAPVFNVNLTFPQFFELLVPQVFRDFLDQTLVVECR